MTDTHRTGLIGLGVVVVTTLVALNGVLVGEVGVVELLDELPRTVVDVLKVPMQLGTRGAVVLVAIVAAALTDRRRLHVGVAVVAAGMIAWVGANALKDVVDRPRPRGAGAVVSVDDSWSGTGFPSTHTAVATASLTAAAFATRRRADAAVAVGAVVGVARMAVGVHLPLDVIGGLGLGVVIAAATAEVADRVR